MAGYLPAVGIVVSQRIVPHVPVEVDIAREAERLRLDEGTDRGVIVPRHVVVEVGFLVEISGILFLLD